jgi:hypothetical protein
MWGRVETARRMRTTTEATQQRRRENIGLKKGMVNPFLQHFGSTDIYLIK